MKFTTVQLLTGCLGNLYWYVTESLIFTGWVSDAENCTYKDYSSAYKNIFEHLGFNNTNILMTNMQPAFWRPNIVYVDLYVTSIIDVV